MPRKKQPTRETKRTSKKMSTKRQTKTKRSTSSSKTKKATAKKTATKKAKPRTSARTKSTAKKATKKKATKKVATKTPTKKKLKPTKKDTLTQKPGIQLPHAVSLSSFSVFKVSTPLDQLLLGAVRVGGAAFVFFFAMFAGFHTQSLIHSNDTLQQAQIINAINEGSTDQHLNGSVEILFQLESVPTSAQVVITATHEMLGTDRPLVVGTAKHVDGIQWMLAWNTTKPLTHSGSYVVPAFPNGTYQLSADVVYPRSDGTEVSLSKPFAAPVTVFNAEYARE